MLIIKHDLERKLFLSSSKLLHTHVIALCVEAQEIRLKIGQFALHF